MRRSSKSGIAAAAEKAQKSAATALEKAAIAEKLMMEVVENAKTVEEKEEAMGKLKAVRKTVSEAKQTVEEAAKK